MNGAESDERRTESRPCSSDEVLWKVVATEQLVTRRQAEQTPVKSVPVKQRGGATWVWQPNPAAVAADEPVSMARSGREETAVPGADPREHRVRQAYICGEEELGKYATTGASELKARVSNMTRWSEQPGVTVQHREAGADVPEDVKTDPQSKKCE